MKKILFIFVFTIFFSCTETRKKDLEDNTSNNDTISKSYYDSNRKIKEVILKDSIQRKYYLNGNIFSDGKLNSQQQRIGLWDFYTKEGLLSETRDYRIINGESYLNQNIYYSKEGSDYWMEIRDQNFNIYSHPDFSSDTLSYSKTYYAEFDLGKDTIKLSEPWRAVCYYYTPIFRNKNAEAVILLGGKGNTFNSDFSNIQNIKKDTFYSLKKDIDNRKNFPDDDVDYTIVFGKWFDTPGLKLIRGYLSEFYREENTNELIEKRVFFEKEVYVDEDNGLE